MYICDIYIYMYIYTNICLYMYIYIYIYIYTEKDQRIQALEEKLYFLEEDHRQRSERITEVCSCVCVCAREYACVCVCVCARSQRMIEVCIPQSHVHVKTCVMYILIHVTCLF